MTNDRIKLQAEIDRLDPDNASAGADGGGTNHPNGLVWGWRTVSSKWKSRWHGDTPSSIPSRDASVKKIVVLMTDGEPSFPDGTRTAYGFRDEERLGAGSQKTRMLERTKAICNRMKAEGVQLYTIVFA